MLFFNPDNSILALCEAGAGAHDTIPRVNTRLVAIGLVRWTGLLFVVGAALFALGVLLSVLPGSPPLLAAVTYAIGAVFFTAGATAQFVLARRELPDAERRWLPVRAGTADWLAAASQLVGTVLFNVNTVDAVLTIGARPELVDAEVWVPDVLGSIAFLVSSAIAIVPEVRARRLRHVADAARRIALLNLAGSILFAISALGALQLRSGADVSLAWANVGTFFGALCFLAGAWLFGWPPGSREAHHGSAQS